MIILMALSCDRTELPYRKIREKIPSGSQSLPSVREYEGLSFGPVHTRVRKRAITGEF